MGVVERMRAARAQRALDRQLVYQQEKSAKLTGMSPALIRQLTLRTHALRERLGEYGAIGPDTRVLEVGSGTTGHIFFFGAADGVGVDPLADHYRSLFPAWQSRARTIAVGGEALPFADESFDLVLCDNVVDHAERPDRIVAEMARVLATGGLLYFTVNVHHKFYDVAARLHAAWQSLGLPGEIGPFADHTVHLTPKAARRLFAGLPLRLLSETPKIAEAKRDARQRPPRHPGDLLKRLFYKNAVYEVIARREPAV